jgi:hypothetical protein
MVITPSKSIARVVRIYPPPRDEALVEWEQTGETANIRVKLLTRIPKKEASDGP